MVEAPSPRRGRRVSSLLNTYYHFEGGDQQNKKEEQVFVQDEILDRPGFDAEKYFDDVIASGQLADLRQRTDLLDAEVDNLDTNMQMMVYENYTKFVRATDVIKQMKFTIAGLQPDMQSVEGNLKRITEYQRAVDNGVLNRTRQVEHLLKQQRISKKLQTLFDLPRTLQRCLDRGAYGTAVEAYCNCAGFLRQYKDLPAFQKVLGEVDNQMSRIRSALEDRLHSPELSVDEAVNSAWTLLDLGENESKVSSEYLHGRCAVLQQSLKHCFDIEPALEESDKAHMATSSAARPDNKLDVQDLQRPESIALCTACSRAASSYVPSLSDAVEGLSKLRKKSSAEAQGAEAQGAISEDVLSDFVSARVQELCTQLTELIEKKCSPTRVLVSCIHSVRDALRRLHSLLPQLLTRLFTEFLDKIATFAMKALFADARSSFMSSLLGLHGECKRLQESKNSGLDDVLEEIAQTEEAIVMKCFTSLTSCQPLLPLLGHDKTACQKLVRGLHAQLIQFFTSFVDACYAYIGGGNGFVTSATLAGTTLPTGGDSDMSSLAWSGLFGLALVRIGRHFEVKAIPKVWAVAKDLFVGCGEATAELNPSLALARVMRGATQAVIKHYALASGQRLAHFFRNSVQNRNWVTVREPREPRLIVEIVLKEVYAFDAQLARILGDPRKVRAPTDTRRSVLIHQKSAMEIEVERLLAKKMPVYAAIPFNRNGAIVGILRVAFKALYEYMREETFAKHGLQQIQVDCAFLADVVRSDFVEPDDASILDSLLDEVVESAKSRCVEPVLMDAARVEALCDEKKKGFKFE